MSRIPLTTVDQQCEPIREFMARRGELNVFRLLARAPAVFVGWTQMVDEMLDSPTFTLRMRELIILRVAHLQDAPYEFSQHMDLARSAGLTERQIEAILGAGDNGDLGGAGFSRTERVVLDAVTELCTTRHLGEDSVAAVQAALGDEAVTELLMIVSCYYGLALVLNAVELDIDITSRLQARTGEHP
ncbi:MAG: carboxymuconolactone decarboxylase family protein [Mycobacterium sp.]|uniref:carboxymuconolactone decarboxylase family protein n=1 Tax=Mycobacterium sp. TaxID=1785 RepID=UPI003F96D14F